MLDDIAASPESYDVDGQADRAGRATPRVYDTVFIGQRKISDQPLSLSRVVLVFDLPPLQDGQRLVSATLLASYINDRAYERNVPAVNLYHAAGLPGVPNDRPGQLGLYGSAAFADTGLDLIEDGMRLGPVSVDVTDFVATSYASPVAGGAATFRLQAMDQPLIQPDGTPRDNRYGIRGFVDRGDGAAPPTLNLVIEGAAEPQ
ncbi:MAG: hypothetical protein AAF593_00470 [Planctomycetota bacterium]